MTTEESSLAVLSLFEPSELAKRAQRGDTESYERLVYHFRPRLIYLLSKRLRNTGIDAEDIAQESLLRAYTQLDQFDPKYQFSTWLFTIAFRLATDAVRGNLRNPVHSAVEWDVELLANTASKESEANAIATEQVDRIWEIANKALTASQFEVLWLKHGEEMSISQIASVLKRTQVGVRVLLYRAREQMMKALEKDK